MKIHGIKLEGPAKKTIVLPRETGNIVFVFQAVLNSEEFKEIYPAPSPPTKEYAGGKKVKVYDDPAYQKKLQKWSELKGSWVFLKSIEATPGLEWETVDLANPDTWNNYEKELEFSGFTEMERLTLLNAYLEVQGLDSNKIQEATNSFLAGLQEEKKEGLSPSTEASDMPSGEVASG